MSAPAVERAITDPQPEAPSRAPRRGPVLVLAAVVLAALLGVAALLGAVAGEPERIAVSFGGDPQAIESDWGNLEHFGVAGSWIVVYLHGATITMEVPWDGDEVASAVLAEQYDVDLSEQRLLTVTDVTTTDGMLRIDLAIGNCRYYNERELDIYTQLRTTDVDGDVETFLLGKPIITHSPMLNGCPDRTLNRQDDLRGETYRR